MTARPGSPDTRWAPPLCTLRSAAAPPAADAAACTLVSPPPSPDSPYPSCAQGLRLYALANHIIATHAAQENSDSAAAAAALFAVVSPAAYLADWPARWPMPLPARLLRRLPRHGSPLVIQV